MNNYCIPIPRAIFPFSPCHTAPNQTWAGLQVWWVRLLKKKSHLLDENNMSRNEVEWENGICGCFNDCSLCELKKILLQLSQLQIHVHAQILCHPFNSKWFRVGSPRYGICSLPFALLFRQRKSVANDQASAANDQASAGASSCIKDL